MKKSPFPGMDPWLESHWGDIHTRLTMYASDQLQPHLPPGLHAHVEEYVTVGGLKRAGRFEPDVRVVEHAHVTSDEGVVAVAKMIDTEPIVLQLQRRTKTSRSIKIVDCNDGDRVVTTIEFLSRVNKTTREGRKQFRQKQRKMCAAEVNLVEVDLLRSGHWVMSVEREELPDSHCEPYRICVVRTADSYEAEVYPAPLQRCLPTIRIPLRPTDTDVLLNLQALIEAAYINGKYGEILDYNQEPKPPLSPVDAQWADQRLREANVRQREPPKDGIV